LAGLFASIIRIARPAAWLAVGALALSAAQFAQAQAVWVGEPGVAADWFDPANWLGGALPNSNFATVTINNGGIAQRNQNLSTSVANIFLGSAALTSGTLSLSAGTLSTSEMQVGVLGTGRVDLSAGVLITSNPLNIGTGSAGSGIFNVTGGTFSNNSTLNLGSDLATTTGTFTQSGGVGTLGSLMINTGGRYNFTQGSLWIKTTLASTGEFDFANGSGTMLVAQNGLIDWSRGTLTGTADANVSAGPGALIILPAGATPAMFATFSNAGRTHIAGNTLTIAPGESFVAWRGDLYEDVAVQGSLVSSVLSLHKGLSISGSGIASLSLAGIANTTSGISGGTLNATFMTVGSESGAAFLQSSGSVSLFKQAIGTINGTTGSYSLTGGTLTVANTTVGAAGTGSLTQTGGFSSFGTLSVGAGSSFRYTGGALDVAALTIHGELDLASNPVTIAPTGIADFTSATFAGTSNATLIGAPDSLMIFSPGVDPTAVFGSFSTGGTLHTAGSTLVIPTGATINGIGEIEDPVEIHGSLLGGVPVGGMTLYDGGVLNSGSATLSSTQNEIRGGDLTLFRLDLVDGGAIVQSGGTATITFQMSMGVANSSSTGMYTLTDGELRTFGDGPSKHNSVLEINNGTFLQSGGNNDIYRNIAGATGVGIDPGGIGYYELSGGTLNATSTNFSVGYSGTGTMIQSAGMALIDSIRLGEQRTGIGYYSLSGSGTLAVIRSAAIGLSGQGTMVQSAGTFTTPWLAIDFQGTSGQFLKTDGYLAVGSLTIGDNGTFIHSGGTLTIPAMNNTGTAVLGGTQIWAPNSIATNFGFASFTSNAGAGGRNLTINDTEGTVVFSSSQTLNALNIGQGRASIVPGSNAVIGMLGLGMSVFSPVHAFDLADGTLVINYLSTTPAESVRSMLAADQLFSSLADAQHRLGYAEVTQVYSPLPAMIGDEPIDSTGLIAQLTLAGDANLDGVVDAVDLGNLALHWTSSDAFWFDGDFTYDGRVDVADLKLLALNFDTGAGGPSLETLLASFGLPVDAVPEPSVTIGIIAIFLMGRRRHCA
jgi:hypothetical protein